MASGSSEIPPEIRKKLFKSPVVEGDRLADGRGGLTLWNQLQIQHNIETSRKVIEKELVDQRLKQLRQKLASLSEDNWRYPSVEKLIGQH